MVDPLNYFSFQAVLNNWCNKRHGMYYPVCGMHIKDPLLLMGKCSPCGSSGFSLCVSEWSFIYDNKLQYCIKWDVLIELCLGNSYQSAISRSGQCSMAGVTKAVVCVILCVG